MSDFTLICKEQISSLNIVIEEYEHIPTGTRHLHLAADDNNNAFLVAFLTEPEDSTGVAHILEHTSLCGSKRYPVRDPFFMMLRRSLNTFMNAFTSSDWTAYPFASQNVKDFNNLLEVYLDATFFPNLDVLDFAQEGHRLEFETPHDPESPLVYKGVVFNEMKGALSSPVQRLWQAVHHTLFPTITYHYNSGGEPKDIPQLTHAQLKAFHATHYHPSNAIFMTYGDRSAESHQKVFAERVLQHYQKTKRLHIPNEQRYDTPQQATSFYPLDKKEDSKNKTHIVLAWLLGNSTDIQEVMAANLLTGVLLDNSASPLRHALETTDLGVGPSPLCGFDESSHESSFMCGLEGSNPEHADAVEALIFKVLTEVAEKGVPLSLVESVLHQIELSQREITGDGFPYGLRLLLNGLSPMIHGGNPIDFLDIDTVLNDLSKKCQDADFIPNLIRTLLLDNPHRVRIVMAPQETLAAQEIHDEKMQLEARKADMSAADKTNIIAQTKALEARQQTDDDPDVLPKVGLEDIADILKIPEGTAQAIDNLPTTWFARGTNGMIYQTLVLDLPEFDDDLLEILPLFCACVTEVGCGKETYRETAARQAAEVGGISARISQRGSVSDVQNMRSMFCLGGKALVRNQEPLAKLLRDTLEQARFDELPRLRELIAQMRAASDNSVTARGHQLAMNACSSGMSPAGYYASYWNGLVGMHRLKSLDDSLEDQDNLKAFAQKFEHIRTKILEAPRQLLVISESEHHHQIEQTFANIQWHTASTAEYTPFKPVVVNKVIKQVWRTNTPVNFCAKAYPTVAGDHVDAPALMLLGNFLQNGYLHRALREKGGAYGGGAQYDGNTGAFRFYSYRDPRLVDTLKDFDQSLQWLHTHKHADRALEEAILGVISHIDRPGSPAGEAMTSFFSSLHERTPKHRRDFRHRMLQVTLTDLLRVAKTYLQPEKAHIAVLTNAKNVAELPADLGLELCIL